MESFFFCFFCVYWIICIYFFREEQVTNTVNIRNKLPDKRIQNNNNNTNKINDIKWHTQNQMAHGNMARGI